MTALETYLNSLTLPGGPRGWISSLPSGAAWMLFGMESGAFRLFMKSGYRDEEFRYTFLENQPELWNSVSEKGALILPSALASVPDRDLWIILDRTENPEYLMILEVPEGFSASPEFLRLMLLTRSIPFSEDRKALPAWLDRMLPECLRAESPLLLISEEGSGSEQLIRFLLTHRFGGGYARFNPGRLSPEVQLREFYGENTGERLRSSSVIPVVSRALVIVVGEVANLAPALQLRIFSELAGGLSQKFWILETSRDLAGMVRAGQFDASLADLLAKKSILIPPLRKCRSEILAEADRYLGDLFAIHSRKVVLSTDARNLVQEYDWPGNLDEMHATLELAYLMSREGVVQPGDLRPGLWSKAGQDDLNLRRRTEELEIRLILQAHALHGGNQVHMARALGISRGSLQYRLNKIGLEG